MDVVARGLSAHALLHSEEDSDLRVHLALHAEGTEWQEILNPIPRDPEAALAVSGDCVRGNTFEHGRKNSAVDDAAALGLSLSGITVTPRFAHEDEKETDQALIGKTNDRSCKQELAADTAEGQCSLDGQTGIASDVDRSSPRLVLNVSMPGVPLRQAEVAQIVGWRGRSATRGEAARVDGAVSQSTDEEVAPQGIAQRRRAEERVSTPRDALDKGVNKAWPDMMISASGIDLFLMLMTSLFDPSTHCLPHAPTDSVDFCYPQTHTHTHTHTHTGIDLRPWTAETTISGKGMQQSQRARPSITRPATDSFSREPSHVDGRKAPPPHTQVQLNKLSQKPNTFLPTQPMAKTTLVTRAPRRARPGVAVAEFKFPDQVPRVDLSEPPPKPRTPRVQTARGHTANTGGGGAGARGLTEPVSKPALQRPRTGIVLGAQDCSALRALRGQILRGDPRDLARGGAGHTALSKLAKAESIEDIVGARGRRRRGGAGVCGQVEGDRDWNADGGRGGRVRGEGEGLVTWGTSITDASGLGGPAGAAGAVTSRQGQTTNLRHDAPATCTTTRRLARVAQGELGNLPPAQTAQTAKGFFVELPAYIEIDCSAPVWGTSVLVPPGQAAMAPSHQAAPTLHAAPGEVARGAERSQARPRDGPTPLGGPRGIGPVCVNARGNAASGHVPFTFLWAGQRPIYERSAPAQVSVSCRLCGCAMCV